MLCSMTCRFCFHKGKFFVLMNASQKGGKWIAMGPDRCFYFVRLTLRKVSIPFTILLLLASLLVCFVFQRLPSAEFGWFLVISYAVTIVSYLYTSLCDLELFGRLKTIQRRIRTVSSRWGIRTVPSAACTARPVRITVVTVVFAS